MCLRPSVSHCNQLESLGFSRQNEDIKERFLGNSTVGYTWTSLLSSSRNIRSKPACMDCRSGQTSLFMSLSIRGITEPDRTAMLPLWNLSEGPHLLKRQLIFRAWY